MEIIPDTKTHRTTAEDTTNNFEALGLDVESPERVVYGFTPRGKASYNPSVDTVFMGPETIKADDMYELATFEHENIHYEQYRRILGESPEDLHSLAREVEKNALSNALQTFDEDILVDALTDDQHLNYYNFRTMLGFASGHKEFIDEACRINEGLSGRLENFPEPPEHQEDVCMEELHYAEVAQSIEETAEFYWNDIVDGAEEFSPLIERYDISVNDDVLEGQAQFWELFRLGELDDLPKDKQVYPEPLRKRLDGLDTYARNRFYEKGESVEDATKNIVERFRERKHTEGREDHEIAVDMLNRGLENWKRPEPKV